MIRRAWNDGSWLAILCVVAAGVTVGGVFLEGWL